MGEQGYDSRFVTRGSGWPCCSIYPWSRCLVPVPVHTSSLAAPPHSTHPWPERASLPFPALPWIPAQGSPDVVYAYTPKNDVAVEVSTCGSLFDTRLYVFDDLANPQVGQGGLVRVVSGWGTAWQVGDGYGQSQHRAGTAQSWRGWGWKSLCTAVPAAGPTELVVHQSAGCPPPALLPSVAVHACHASPHRGVHGCRLLSMPALFTPQNYVGNDDDPSCTSNGKASRLSTTFQVRTGLA